MGFYDEREKMILKNTEMVLFDQMEQITSKRDINNQELDALYQLADVLKDIKTICAMDEAGQQGYSRMNYSYDEGEYSQMRTPHMGWGYPTDGMSYNQGNSYMRGRDSRTGRYYSRDEGKGHFMTELQRMMNEATTEKERNAIMQCMNNLEG